MLPLPVRATVKIVTVVGTLAAFAGCQASGVDGEAEPRTVSGIPNPEALDAVIAAERAFSAMSAEGGMRDAFLTYFAAEAVSFTPQPTVGTGDLAAGPAGPKLEWWPEVAEASRAGDMGYTSGPYRVPLPDGAFSWGHYHSVWGLQPDGSWKVLLDMGGPHGDVEAPAGVHRPESSWNPEASPVDAGTLLEQDRAFLQAYEVDGEAAVREFALPRARFYRFGQLPLEGVDQALANRGESGERLTWEPMDGQVATSGDLGFTYGTGTMVRGETGGASMGMSYARVWRGTPEGWRVVLEVVLPYPPTPDGP